VQEVTCRQPYHWTEGPWDLTEGYQPATKAPRFKVVAYDFGIKRNILRNLVASGCDVTVVPADTPAEEVLAMNPDGVFLSNGPGDPEPIVYAQENIRKLLGKKPIFGICLGHQLLSIALGGKTYKLKFGHRGGNQPVRRGEGHEVEITAQNHGFAVDADSIRDAGSSPTSTSTTTLSRGSPTGRYRPSRCSTTPRPRRVRMMPGISSSGLRR
jgi:carbamoyl-phosphate synthase small subunit